MRLFGFCSWNFSSGPVFVQVIEGLSTAVDLPEKVDLLVAEVIGSVATEEGVYRTIRDAQARFMLNPEDPRNYIPFRVCCWGSRANLTRSVVHY